MTGTRGAPRGDYFAELLALGGRHLSTEDWTALHARHGQVMDPER